MATPVSSTVLKSFELLRLLAAHPSLTVDECASRLSMPRSTVYRLLSTLRQAQVLEGGDGRFRAGPLLLEMALPAPARQLLGSARRALEHVADATGLDVEIVLRSEKGLLSLERVRGRHSASLVGICHHAAMHATAAGKVLLAFAPQEVVDARIAAGLRRFTPHTITEPDDLCDQLGQARLRGWADEHEELAVGFGSLAVPVRQQDDHVAVAMMLSGSAAAIRWQQRDLRRLLLATARGIAGGRPSAAAAAHPPKSCPPPPLPASASSARAAGRLTS